MMMTVHHDDHHRPFQSSQRGGGGGGDGDYGPTSHTNLSPSTNHHNIYDGAAAVVGGGAAVRTDLQAFDICSTTSPVTYTDFKSPGGGGGMAASVGFPFTNAQWKELKRQAMIYKYMVSSVPVPLDLLLPISRNLSASVGSEFKLRFSNGTDPEPGRCKRTDGKKWRCSRDVAPDQKYCERHMHRGRPRSRKHVELHVNNNNNNANKRTRHDHHHLHHQVAASSPATLATSSCPQTQFLGSSSAALPYHPSPVFLDKSAFESVPSDLSADKEGRSIEWMMKEEPVPMAASDPRWLHLMQTKIEIPSKPSSAFSHSNNSSIFSQQAEEEPFLNLNSYANFTAGESEQDRDCGLFLNPDAISLDNNNNNSTNSETPRSFIDAWSKTTMEETMANNGSVNKSSVSSQGKLSPSSLTLSMGGSGSIKDELGQTQIGAGGYNGSDGKSHVTSWLTPASWVALQPGGPLAEVLRPSSVTAAGTGAVSDPSSSFTGNGDSGSPMAAVVSSPSGVLQKTLASLSDSSGCSSPALGSSKIKAEISLL